MRIVGLLCVAGLWSLAACAPPEVVVPPPADESVAPSAGGGGAEAPAAPAGGDSQAPEGNASASDRGLVDGPGDRGGLGKEDVVAIRAEMLCADKQASGDEAARAQLHAEILAKYGTQKKFLEQVLEDITEEPELKKQLDGKVEAKAAELCPEGGAAEPKAEESESEASDAPTGDEAESAAPADEKKSGEGDKPAEGASAE